MADNCDRCRRLEQQNRQLQQRLERARQVCAYWHNRCVEAKQPADVVLAQKSGVPRAVYGFNQGLAGGLGQGIAGLSEVYHALEDG